MIQALCGIQLPDGSPAPPRTQNVVLYASSMFVVPLGKDNCRVPRISVVAKFGALSSLALHCNRDPRRWPLTLFSHAFPFRRRRRDGSSTGETAARVHRGCAGSAAPDGRSDKRGLMDDR